LAVQGCGETIRTYQVYPSALDLAVEPKPVPTPEILTSEAAADAYDASLEAWGERGWAAVSRICRWANANGGKFECPAHEP
jgi:hypothetical protein